MYTSRWFGNDDTKLNQPTLQFLRNETHVPWLKDPRAYQDALKSDSLMIAEIALKAAREKRFFHWELEFPEVFFGPSKNSAQEIVLKENPGFDAVIGNPPWVDVQMYGRRFKPSFVTLTNLQWENVIYMHYLSNVGFLMIKLHGSFSMIIQSKFLVTEYGFGIKVISCGKCRFVIVSPFC